MQGENERQLTKMRKLGDPGIFVPWGSNLTTLLIKPNNLCPSTPLHISFCNADVCFHAQYA